MRYKGKSISDVLDMTISEAYDFFESHPKLKIIIATLKDVGLGYISLGQPSTTLSGGEAQRVKLASELSRANTGNTLYILDEPTTGLHFQDIEMLLDVLHRLVKLGNTVVVIEHQLDVIKVADHVIDIGPEEVLEVGRLSQKEHLSRSQMKKKRHRQISFSDVSLAHVASLSLSNGKTIQTTHMDRDHV